MGRSEACPFQGFVFNRKIMALRFHLETTPESAALLVEHARSDWSEGGPYVQNPIRIAEHPEHFLEIRTLMKKVWSGLTAI